MIALPRCWFLLQGEVNQRCACLCPLLLEPPAQVVTELWATSVRFAAGSRWLAVSHEVGCYLGAASPTHPAVSSPSPTVSTGAFSMSVFPPCRDAHLYHFSRFRMHVCELHTMFILLFLASFTLYKTLVSSASLQMTQSCFFFFFFY